MEDENVATSVEMTPERVQRCVDDLNALFDQIETDFLPRVKSAQSVQTTAVWSAAPPAVDFLLAMSTVLDTAEDRLKDLWAEVRRLCETLQRNAADIENMDAATAEALARLLTRADTQPEGPDYIPAPVPYAPGYTVPATAPSPFLTPPASMAATTTTASTSPFADLLGPTPGGGASYASQ